MLDSFPAIDMSPSEHEGELRKSLTAEQSQFLDRLIEKRLTKARISAAKNFVASNKRAIADAVAKANAEHEAQLKEALAAISNKSDIDLEQAYADWRAEHFSAANA